MMTSEGQAMRPRAGTRWLRGTVALFLIATLGAAVFLADRQMNDKSGLRDVLRLHGSPVFVADEASIKQGRIILINALQLDDTALLALQKGVPRRFFGKWLMLCDDRVQAESLKVLHAASITVGRGALSADPVASAIADTPHPVDAELGALSLVRIDARGGIGDVRTERFSEIAFRFQ